MKYIHWIAQKHLLTKHHHMVDYTNCQMVCINDETLRHLVYGKIQ